MLNHVRCVCWCRHCCRIGRGISFPGRTNLTPAQIALIEENKQNALKRKRDKSLGTSETSAGRTSHAWCNNFMVRQSHAMQRCRLVGCT